MNKKAKFQYPGSNRHGQPLTNKDKMKKYSVYQDARLEFDVLSEDELQIINATGKFEDEILTETRKRAAHDALKMKSLVKLINNEPEQAQA